MKLRLSSRGLLLIAFPVVCQLLIVGVITVLLFRMQAEITAEQESRELMAELHTIETKMSSDLMIFNLPGKSDKSNAGLIDKMGQQLYKKRNAEIQAVGPGAYQPASPGHPLASSTLENHTLMDDFTGQYIKDFDKLIPLAGDTKTKETLSKVKYLFVTNMQWAINAAALKEKGDASWLRVRDQYQRHALKLAIQVIDEIEALTKADEYARSKSPARSIATRNQVAITLAIAIVASALLAVFLGRVYGKGIAEPLRQIAENSRKLAKQEPLLPVLEDCAELTELDLVLHFVADSVKLAITREKALIANAADVICSFDSSGKITAVNPYVHKLLGFDAEKLVGQSVEEIVAAEHNFLALELIRNACLTEEVQTFDLKLRRADSTTVETRWTCFWSASEQRLFCVVHDITEANVIARLKQDFTDMIRQDLREPLSSIKESMDLMASGTTGELTEGARKESASIARNTDKLIKLVNDLLDMQKLDSGKIELESAPTQLDAVISESVDFVRGFAESKKITIEVTASQLTVDCDKQKMIQTMVNLLSNAIKFSPEGSKVGVDVAIGDNSAKISITDSGPGVPESMREQIFEPYEQLQSDGHQGTGLGLAICKLIINAHGGSIGVRPAVHTNGGDQLPQAESGAMGSTFWFEIPKSIAVTAKT